jgi:hypothetical protein
MSLTVRWAQPYLYHVKIISTLRPVTHSGCAHANYKIHLIKLEIHNGMAQLLRPRKLGRRLTIRLVKLLAALTITHNPLVVITAIQASSSCGALISPKKCMAATIIRFRFLISPAQSGGVFLSSRWTRRHLTPLITNKSASSTP